MEKLYLEMDDVFVSSLHAHKTDKCKSIGDKKLREEIWEGREINTISSKSVGQHKIRQSIQYWCCACNSQEISNRVIYCGYEKPDRKTK